MVSERPTRMMHLGTSPKLQIYLVYSGVLDGKSQSTIFVWSLSEMNSGKNQRSTPCRTLWSRRRSTRAPRGVLILTWRNKCWSTWPRHPWWLLRNTNAAGCCCLCWEVANHQRRKRTLIVYYVDVWFPEWRAHCPWTCRKELGLTPGSVYSHGYRETARASRINVRPETEVNCRIVWKLYWEY